MGFLAALPAIASAAATVGSGYMQSRSAAKSAEAQRKAMQKASQETKTQRTQRHLIDELLGSVKGKGRFADLFNEQVGQKQPGFDPTSEAFQKSYVDPAKNLFTNQIAPQIQQKYIGTGQQGSSGLNDQLL